MSPRQKQVALIGGAVVLLYLLYRWYSNSAANAAQTTASTTGTDASESDYASLAGQEQSDVASLQAQEQSDVQALGGDLSSLTTAEQADAANITTLTANQQTDESNLTNLVNDIPTILSTAVQAATQAVAPSITSVTTKLNSVAAGETATNRLATETSLLLAHPGWMAAPFGAKKPTAPKGFTAVGLGNGYWAFKPTAAPAKPKKK